MTTSGLQDSGEHVVVDPTTGFETRVVEEPRSVAEAREELMSVAGEVARSRGEALRHWAGKNAIQATRVVRHRPATAVIAAAGVGLVLGLLLSR